MKEPATQTLQGSPISPGLAEGTIHVHRIVPVPLDIPAAALSASKLAAHSDFLSIGTNDLTQYTFAADRENAAVERYFDDAAETIFRLIQITRDDVPRMPLSLCEELAGRPEHTARQLEFGIETFSVAPPLIPALKEAIRKSECHPPIQVVRDASLARVLP